MPSRIDVAKVNLRHRRQTAVETSYLTTVGIGVGALAFTADWLSDPVSRLLTPLVSSGFAWSCTALVCGLTAHTLPSALRRGVGVPVLATLAYYGLILFASRRWHHGGETDGSPLLPYGLPSVAKATTMWLIGSIFAGIIMGFLAHKIRRGAIRTRTIATGVSSGLLASDGAHSLLHVAFFWIGPIDSFIIGKVQSALIQVSLAISTSIIIFRIFKLQFTWPAFASTATMSTATSICLWHVVSLFEY
ncbi:DUF6518 family protein [Micromonospora sonneratiae]|uniref:DUF6518 family protein n=1 Tax=Micromonospora sonneratiae TaxID=1184706 RepID=A0ABW3YID9_9ACTN